jgi:uncharacterized protein (DUF924 family)
MYEQVLQFWFGECTVAQWWGGDAQFDALILHRYAELHARAGAGELYAWRQSVQGRLAEVIVLDQFSRNCPRHSESAYIHVQDQSLFAAAGNAATLQFELKHKAIIDRFGRYPHRNAILGRPSTAEELAFLAMPGSSF